MATLTKLSGAWNTTEGYYVNGVEIIDANGVLNVVTQLKFGDGEYISDTNGNELVKFAVTASAVNEISITNAATAGVPTISATGGDTNIAVLLKGKGTGAVQLGQATSVGVTLMADQPILDSSANEYIKFTKASSAVNEITIGNAATGAAASITATGGDTDVSLIIGAKGAGVILGRSLTTIKQGTQTAKTTSTTLTAAELKTGIITVNQGGGATSALQLPLATDMDTLFTTMAADDAFDFSVINISAVAAEDASVTTNTGWTLVGNMDIASNAAATDKSAGRFRARKTGTGTWTLYRLS